MITWALVGEGARMAARAVRCRLRGPERFSGDAAAISSAVVDACWNGRHFMTSRGNYPVFYARDFGMCADALLAIGMRARVEATLRYALARYAAHGRFRLAVNPRGTPFDFPDVYSPDGFAFFLHSLVALGDRKLVEEYRGFLEREVMRFYDEVVDGTTGLPKRNKHFSGMRDYVVRDASCYDCTMIAAVQGYAEQLQLSIPRKRNYANLLKQHYWNGRFFEDDMSRSGELAGDSNVAPFWFRVFPAKQEKALFARVLVVIGKEGLDRPIPLRYEHGWKESQRMIWLERFVSGWERDTVWFHLGYLYLQVLARLDREEAERQLARYGDVIARVRGSPEVLTKEGALYRSPFFHADTTMLWAANFLALERALRHA